VASILLNGWVIAGFVVLAYAVVVYVLWRQGFIGRDRTLSLFGPALMIKTKKGREFIDRVGQRRRLWSTAGDVAIVLAAVTMVAMIVLLLIDAVVSFRISASQAPSVQEALGIPGINPIIPIGYGIVALVVGVVLHELFHGFVARSQRIGVKTLGVLWCVVPIGAFVEQDDQDMEHADRRRRDRVAAAGVLANFLLAVVFFVALSAIIASSIAPNANGVGVVGVVGGYPAQNATIASGDIITSLNGTPTPDYTSLENALAATHPGQTVSVVFYSTPAGGLVTRTVPLTSAPGNLTKPFLGVTLSYLTPSQLQATLVNPFSSTSSPLTGAVNWLVLPIAGLEPISGAPQQFFHFTGPLASTDAGWNWIGLNLLYWFAWMNFLLGASNALPLIPLDGGLLVRDYMAAIAARVKKGWDAARADRFGSSAAVVSSMLVVVLIVWQFVVPRL
jgi:membrane-associated protease RseP (regulator of RpoE activity)